MGFFESRTADKSLRTSTQLLPLLLRVDLRQVAIGQPLRWRDRARRSTAMLRPAGFFESRMADRSLRTSTQSVPLLLRVDLRQVTMGQPFK
ncbi:hypothetical protein [Actinokineospora inagensis]|uniref:hypothetical protein n=1 Tax=Actinokineospora inagensis TaxID=103730 RepID=UPI00055297B6